MPAAGDAQEPSSGVAGWDPCAVRVWAVEAGLEEATAEALVAHKVDGQALLELTAEEIKEIVPTMGPRKALQRAQRELQQSARAGLASGDGEWQEVPDASLDQPGDGTTTEEPPKPSLHGCIAIHTASSVLGETPFAEIEVDLNGSLLDLKRQVHELSGVAIVPDEDLVAESVATDGEKGVIDTEDAQEASHACGEISCLCLATNELAAKTPVGFASTPPAAQDSGDDPGVCMICRVPLVEAGSDGTASISGGRCGCTFHTDCVERWLRGGSAAPTPSQDSPIQIFCKCPSGKTITLNVDEHETLASVQVKIQAKESIPPAQQRLVYAGKQLERSCKLSEYLIRKESTLHLYVRPVPASDDAEANDDVAFGPTTCPCCAEPWCYVNMSDRSLAPIQLLLPGQDEPLTVATDQCVPCTEIKSRVPADLLRKHFIMAQGKTLFDGAKVQPGSTLCLCHNSRHVGSAKINIHIPECDQPLPVQVTTSETVSDLKKKLQQRTFIRADTIQLATCAPGDDVSKWDILTDEQALSSALNLDSEPTLTMSVFKNERLVLDLALLQADGSCFMLTSTSESELLPLTEWGVSDSSVIYASWRKDTTRHPPRFMDPGTGRLSIFSDSSAWSPAVGQTPKGMSTMLSSLYMLCETMASKPDDAARVINHLAAVLPFPPALLGLRLLIDKRRVTPAHQAAVAQALFALTREQLPDTVPDHKVFEGCIVSLAWLVSGATGQQDAVNFRHESLTCQLSHTRLVHPVVFETLGPGARFSRAVAARHTVGADLYCPGGSLRDAKIEEMLPDPSCAALLLAHPALQEVTVLSDFTPAAPTQSMAVLWQDAKRLVKGCSYLRIISPKTLRNAPRPSITLDKRGLVSLSVESGHSSGGGEITLYSPLSGATTELSEAELSTAVESLDDADTCEELAFDEAECDEAIIFVLDKSNSMDDSAGFTDKPDDPEEDKVDLTEIALHKLLNKQAIEAVYPGAAADYELDISVQNCLAELQCTDAFEDQRAIVADLRTQGDKIEAVLLILAEFCKESEEPEHIGTLIQAHLALFVHALTCLRGVLDVPQDMNPEFLCPITQAMMVDPVVTCDGQTYERSAIQKWFESGHTTSPLTQADLESQALIPNHHLRSMIMEAQQRSQQQNPVESEELPEAVDDGAAVVVDDASAEIGIAYWVGATVRCHNLTSETGRAYNGMVGKITGLGNEGRWGVQLPSERKSKSFRPENLELLPDQTAPDSGVRVEYQDRHVIVPINGEMSVRAFHRLVQKKLNVSFDQELTLHKSNAGGRPSTRVYPPGWGKSSSSPLSTCGVGEHCSLITANDGQRFSTVEVTMSGRRVYEEIPAFSASTNETYRTVIWRMLRSLVASGGVSYARLASLAPSKQHIWSGMKPSGDGVFTGRYHDDHSRVIGDDHYGNSIKLELRGAPRGFKRKPSFMSRLLCVKQLFHALVNRTEAYAFDHYLGLITFGTDVTDDSPLTSMFDNFKLMLDKVKADGDTACYDAVVHAAKRLTEFNAHRVSKGKTPVTKRIICLSDGEDTVSRISAFGAARQLQEQGVLCDAIMVGQVSTGLAGIAKATGGYAFHPTRLKDALKICELETVLCASERPPGKTIRRVDESMFWQLQCRKLDVCDDDTIPPRRSLPGTGQAVHSLEGALLGALHQPASAAVPQPTTFSVRDGQRRLMREMRTLMENPHPSITVLPGEEDISYWQFVIAGPDGTPYRNGHWVCAIAFPEDYPLRPPEVRFLTPILHCNVNSHGKICHSIFDRNYSADVSVKMILDCVYGLLLTPDKHDPIDSTLALSANNDSGEYEASIMRHVQRFASRPHEELVAQLEGGTAEEASSVYVSGTAVMLHGMRSAAGRALNGRTATVDRRQSSGRYLVTLDPLARSADEFSGEAASGKGEYSHAVITKKSVTAKHVKLCPVFSEAGTAGAAQEQDAVLPGEQDTVSGAELEVFDVAVKDKDQPWFQALTSGHGKHWLHPNLACTPENDEQAKHDPNAVVISTEHTHRLLISGVDLSTDTVRDLQEKLHATTGIPIDRQRLLLNGAEMTTDAHLEMTLAACGVRVPPALASPAAVQTRSTTSGDQPMHVFIKSLTGTTTVLEVDGHDTVESVKVKYWTKEKVRPEYQRLIFAGRQLDDHLTLADDCSVCDGHTLHLVLRLRHSTPSFASLPPAMLGLRLRPLPKPRDATAGEAIAHLTSSESESDDDSDDDS